MVNPIGIELNLIKVRYFSENKFNKEWQKWINLIRKAKI